VQKVSRDRRSCFCDQPTSTIVLKKNNMQRYVFFVPSPRGPYRSSELWRALLEVPPGLISPSPECWKTRGPTTHRVPINLSPFECYRPSSIDSFLGSTICEVTPSTLFSTGRPPREVDDRFVLLFKSIPLRLPPTSTQGPPFR